MRSAVAISALLMIVFSPAESAEPAPREAAYALYAAGDYEGAVGAAKAAGGADNLAFAARALNAEAYFAEDRKEARRTAGRAVDAAQEALEDDPGKIEAHLQAAIGYALRGANMGSARVFLTNLPARARRHIDAALALDPDNAWALSTSAAWRLEVYRRGGGSIYGANPDEGYREFIKARALAPDNMTIAYECALRLLASGRESWRKPALDCLKAARGGAPHTDFERRIKARADELAQAYKDGPKAVAAFVKKQP